MRWDLPNGIGGRERAWLVVATPDRLARNRSRTARHAALRSHLGPPPPRHPRPSPRRCLREISRDNLERLSDRIRSGPLSRAVGGLIERGERLGRGWHGVGGDPDAVGGRRVVPCATDSDDSLSGVATSSQARSRPPIAAGGPNAMTGPAPSLVPAPLRKPSVRRPQSAVPPSPDLPRRPFLSLSVWARPLIRAMLMAWPR